MTKTPLAVLLVWLYLASSAAAQDSGTKKKAHPQVVQLTPPALDATTMLFSEGRCCTRPVREGMFDISIKTLAPQSGHKKTIVNCCGMGGAGWTTMPGDVDEAISLFEEKKISKKEPIRIIGAGCLGLYTALELTNRGYNVVGLTAKELYDLPSWQAAGYYALVSIKTAPEEQERLARINFKSFKTYRDIEEGKCGYLSKDVVRKLPVYCSKETESGLEELAASGYIPPAEKVILNFGHGVVHRDFVRYVTYFMNTTKLMQQMRAEVERRGLAITCATVSSFEDCQESILFNCTGLGSRILNQDARIAPVRGHLIILNNTAGTGHMDYMIYTKVIQEGQEEYIYLFPRNVSVTAQHPQGVPCQGALGGTFLPRTDELSPEALEQLDQRAFKKLLERSQEFFYGTKT